MTKYLTAKQKAAELGISTRSLAQSRHFYAHRKVSDRKYLYLEEEAKDYNRPNLDPPSDIRRSRVRRRDVGSLPGDTRYHKCPGGSGESFKLLNQMRAKASLEGKVKPDQLKYLSGAMAIKIKDNAREIVEQDQAKKRSELMAQEERDRKRDPSRYGGMIRGARSGLVDVQTPWRNLYETPKSEYDEALEDLGEQPSKKKSYY
jgi:hypothetical protein